MGFKALLEKVAKTALKTVGDLKVSVTYTHVTGNATYNPVTDVQTPGATTTVTVEGVLTSRSVNEYDYAKVKDNHLKLIVAATDLGFTPASEDSCVINGVHYEVKRPKFVPGDSIYILYLQAA